MKFARFSAALGLAALLAASAAFAQAPAPTTSQPTAVKGYTKTLKNGKKVSVKGYSRMGKSAMTPKNTAVQGYTRTLKSGKKVTVKGYTRKAPAAKPMKKSTM